MTKSRQGAPSAIVFDSCWLQSAGWPAGLSAAHRRLVDLAHDTGVRLYVTQLTKVELRHQMEKKAAELADRVTQALCDAQAAWDKATALGLPVGRERPLVAAEDRAGWSERYSEQERAAIEWHRLDSLPYPTASLVELAERSAQHEPPFRDKDQGFRDALIAMSIAEHAPRDGGDVVFLTNDKMSPSEYQYFREANIKYVNGNETLALQQLLDSLEALKQSDELQRRQEILEAMEHARSVLSDVAREDLVALRAFVKKHLKVPRHIVEKFDGFESIEDIELTQIDGVLDMGEALELVGGIRQEASIAFLVHVNITVRSSPLVVRFASSYGIGDIKPRYQVVPSEPKLESITMECYLTAQVSATGGSFVIAPTSVAVGGREGLVSMLVNSDLRRRGHVVDEESR